MHDGIAHRLLVVAHGTASPEGRHTTDRLIAAVRATRPGITVDLCFLDVALPRLADALDDQPTVLLPLLLSTGFHVQSDIPGIVDGHRSVVVARHLGPDPLLVDALIDRLPVGTTGTRTVLVGAGSSRSQARDELQETATLLGARLGQAVDILTMADDLVTELARRAPVRIATYLLAEGRFTETLTSSAPDPAAVAAPIGAHPELVRLVWKRYDDACDPGRGASPVR